MGLGAQYKVLPSHGTPHYHKQVSSNEIVIYMYYIKHGGTGT